MMMQMKEVLVLSILLAFAFEGTALSSPGREGRGSGNMGRNPTTGIQDRLDTSLVIEKTLTLNRKTTRHLKRKEGLETNQCIFPGADLRGRCRPLSLRKPPQSILEERFFPLEREAHLGSVFLSFTGEDISFGLRNIFGEALWVLRWNFSSEG